MINHRHPPIDAKETRVVAGKTTKGASSTVIDGVEHVTHPGPGTTVKQRQSWSGGLLVMHWEKTEAGTTYVSDIRRGWPRAAPSSSRRNITANPAWSGFVTGCLRSSRLHVVERERRWLLTVDVSHA